MTTLDEMTPDEFLNWVKIRCRMSDGCSCPTGKVLAKFPDLTKLRVFCTNEFIQILAGKKFYIFENQGG